jgi:transcriptional regulator with XRE-family HTH domain
MISTPPPPGPGQQPPDLDFPAALAARLRAVRRQRGLSLHDVETLSAGELKAVVIGSYERGDRQLTLRRVQRIAGFYRLPLSELLAVADTSLPATRLVFNLPELWKAPATATPLRRWVRKVQLQRGDWAGVVLTVRTDDLRALSAMFDLAPSALLDLLRLWGVLASPTDLEAPDGDVDEAGELVEAAR